MMAKFLKCSLLFLSLLPVVLPCIYASELFLFDKSKEEEAGAEKLAEDGNGRINAGISADQSRKSQIVRRSCNVSNIISFASSFASFLARKR